MVPENGCQKEMKRPNYASFKGPLKAIVTSPSVLLGLAATSRCLKSQFGLSGSVDSLTLNISLSSTTADSIHIFSLKPNLIFRQSESLAYLQRTMGSKDSLKPMEENIKCCQSVNE